MWLRYDSTSEIAVMVCITIGKSALDSNWLPGDFINLGKAAKCPCSERVA